MITQREKAIPLQEMARCPQPTPEFKERAVMSKAHSSGASSPGQLQKPSKPFEGFPLFPHATRRWAKKIRGRMVYFGPWADWQSALDKYNQEKEALHAGKRPREAAEGLTVRELCNRYWNHQRERKENGEISPRTFLDGEGASDKVIAHFSKARLVSDLGPDDFVELRSKLAKRYGFVALGNWITRIRGLFKFGFDSGLIPAPVRFGPGFKGPSKKTMRREKARKGKNLFTAEEIRSMLGAAGPTLRAMILLAINCGFGNSDCGNLPLSALDLGRAWIDYPRPKTGVLRRCPLWPETVEALREAIAQRVEPKRPEFSALVFLTPRGLSWCKEIADNPIAKLMATLLKALKLNGYRSFYTLRHTFQTQGDEAKDPVATRFIMGHADQSMSGTYREDVSDERLKAVTDCVRNWLFAAKMPTKVQSQTQRSRPPNKTKPRERTRA
jgi:integrase